MDPWEPMVPQVLLVLPWSLVSFSSAFQCSPSGPTLDVFLSRFFLRSVSQEFQRVSTQHGRHSCPDEVVYSRRCCRRWFSESGRVHPSDRHLNVKKREKKRKAVFNVGMIINGDVGVKNHCHDRLLRAAEYYTRVSSWNPNQSNLFDQPKIKKESSAFKTVTETTRMRFSIGRPLKLVGLVFFLQRTLFQLHFGTLLVSR